MVASDVPLCSRMGTLILRRGGNAADAAVTVALCIGSVNSHSSGIGGGGFIVSRKQEDGDVVSIDAREMAPGLAFKEMYGRLNILSKIGGLSIAIPGELKGLYELFSRHGSGNLTWLELFEPVIELNRKGFACLKVFEAVLAKEYELVLLKVPVLKKSWDFIFKEDGELISEGDWIKRENYADTLELIAKNGSADVFYDPLGPIVQSLVGVIQTWGGIMTPRDFENYHVNVEKPLVSKIDNYTVYTSNGISSGLALLSGLNFFHRVFNSSDNEVQIHHKLIESFKWLSSIRTRFGDIDNRADLIDTYAHSTHWIDDILTHSKFSTSQTFPWRHYEPQYDIAEPQGTSHFSIVDEHDNAVAMTTTVNLLFGSMIYDPLTGIVLNDQMDDFALPNVTNAFNLTPSIHNFIYPYKRPLSSTAPTIIVNDATNRTDFVIGAAGGSRITSAVLQAIVRVYYKHRDLLSTIAFPRLHHQLIPEFVMAENVSVLDTAHRGLVGGLEKLGHGFLETGALTAMNGIKRVKNGALHGVSDWWRKRGEADGY
ncbi:Gamma-glutamyltransferase [Candida viswanathii]|uniref:Gamma-glutamyltransferase n=1 Tax=Candida viswanathii TaxID=5486 RepID=A0A367XSH0_9ASCO|nr:Gamma-glutamyltransferase [Candida viswanathii]